MTNFYDIAFALSKKYLQSEASNTQLTSKNQKPNNSLEAQESKKILPRLKKDFLISFLKVLKTLKRSYQSVYK